MARRPEPDLTDALPNPRQGWLLALVTCVVATLALAWPALSGKFLVSPISDQYIAGYAFREFASDVLRSTGGFALWNPYLFGGLPYVAAMHGDIFYPTFLLREVLPTDAAMTWGFILHVILAGVATYGFARAYGLSFFGALVAGLAYMMSGWVSSYVSPGHDGKLFVSALFPVALWLLLHGVRDGRPWAWGGLAIVTGLGVLSPHPQLLQYMLLGCGVFGLWLAFGMGAQAPPRGVAIRRLAYALGAVALGMAIGAIQYLPVSEYAGWSPRAGGARGYEYNTSYSFPPEELISTLIPEFTGILDDYWGRNGIHFHSEYVGAVTWLLVAAAFRRQVRERATWFWLGTAILFALWALGGFTPFYRIVWALVPGTKYFRAPSTVFYVANFALAVLAGLGAQGILRHPVSRRFLVAGGAAIGTILLLGVTGILGTFASGLAPEGRTMIADMNAPKVRDGALRAMAFAAAALGLAWAIGAGKLRAAVGGWVLAAMLAFDQVTVLSRYWQFSDRATTLYRTDATIDHMRRVVAAEGPARVLPLPVGDGLVSHDAMVTGDGLMVHRLRSVLGYHGNELARWQKLYGKEEGLANVVNPNFLRLANVRWVLSGAPDLSQLPFPGGAPRLVAGPARNASGSMVYLHELQQPAPFAWVTPAMVKAPDDGSLQTILDPRFDLRTVAIFDSAAAAVPAPAQLQAMPAPLDLGVRVTKYEPGAIDLALSAPAPAGAALVVSENYYPGWTATVDGRAAVAARAQFSLIGVPLEAGARTVSLRFASATYERGKLVTLVALALSLVLLVGGLLAGRRPEPAGAVAG